MVVEIEPNRWYTLSEAFNNLRIVEKLKQCNTDGLGFLDPRLLDENDLEAQFRGGELVFDVKLHTIDRDLRHCGSRPVYTPFGEIHHNDIGKVIGLNRSSYTLPGYGDAAISIYGIRSEDQVHEPIVSTGTFPTIACPYKYKAHLRLKDALYTSESVAEYVEEKTLVTFNEWTPPGMEPGYVFVPLNAQKLATLEFMLKEK